LASDVLGCSAEWVDVEMGVTGGCRRLGMPEQFADDGQSETGARTEAGVSVSEVMQAYANQSSAFGNSAPGPVEVSPWGFVVRSSGLTGDDVGS
jgi:hypothetical protein